MDNEEVVKVSDFVFAIFYEIFIENDPLNYKKYYSLSKN